jgi:hypothetical protein
MSNLQFVHQFNKTVSQTNVRTILAENPWSDDRSQIQEVVVNVPAAILSHVFLFQNCRNGRLKLDFLPLKEFLDILDIKLVDAINKIFPDDDQDSIRNLAYTCDNLQFPPNDPLSSLPAAAIKDTVYGQLIKEALFTTMSNGPVDTRLQNSSSEYYDAIRNLYQQAVGHGMIADENNELYPFSDLYSVHFNNNDTLSIRINYRVTKTRKYLFDTRYGTALTGNIMIGGVSIYINPNGYTTSATVSYTIVFRACDTPSYFSYHFLNADRILYNSAVYDVQLIQETANILSIVTSLSSVSSSHEIANGLFMIGALKAAYDNAVTVLSSSLNSTDSVYMAGYQYIRNLITITRIQDVTAAYNTLNARVNIDPISQTVTLEFSEEFETAGSQSAVILLRQPNVRISNNTRSIVVVFPSLPVLIPTYKYAELKITTTGVVGGTILTSLLDGYVNGTTREITISGYRKSSGFTVTLNNVICSSAFLQVTGGLEYISETEIEQCRLVNQQKDILLDALSNYFKTKISKDDLKTSLSQIKTTLRNEQISSRMTIHAHSGSASIYDGDTVSVNDSDTGSGDSHQLPNGSCIYNNSIATSVHDGETGSVCGSETGSVHVQLPEC